MNKNVKFFDKQGQLIFSYLNTEFNLITEQCRNYPLPIPYVFNDDEARLYLKESNKWNTQYELLDRIKNTIESSFLENGTDKIIGYLQLELETIKKHWQKYPLPIPPTLKKIEAEDYLENKQKFETQYVLLNRIYSVVKNAMNP